MQSLVYTGDDDGRVVCFSVFFSLGGGEWEAVGVEEASSSGDDDDDDDDENREGEIVVL